jgi:hypothetical protein
MYEDGEFRLCYEISFFMYVNVYFMSNWEAPLSQKLAYGLYARLLK